MFYDIWLSTWLIKYWIIKQKIHTEMEPKMKLKMTVNNIIKWIHKVTLFCCLIMKNVLFIKHTDHYYSFIQPVFIFIVNVCSFLYTCLTFLLILYWLTTRSKTEKKKQCSIFFIVDGCCINFKCSHGAKVVCCFVSIVGCTNLISIKQLITSRNAWTSYRVISAATFRKSETLCLRI